MSSDKNRAAAVGTRRKTRASANGAPLKQKTLFDSFLIKNAPPKDAVATEAAVLTVDAQASAEVVQDGQIDQSTPVMEDTTPQLPEAISVYATTEFQPLVEQALPSPKAILIDDESPTEAPANHENYDPRPERERSPSIVIIDTDAPSISTSIRGSRTAPFKQEGRTVDLPIVIDTSPTKAPPFSKLNKPVHPFFGAKLKVSTPSLPSPNKAPAIQPMPRLPSFPDRDAQHIRGLQTAISGYQPIFPTRTISDSFKQGPEPRDYNFLKRGNKLEQYNQSPAYLLSNTVNISVLSNIPQEHRLNHPAIARVLDYNPDEPLESRRPWAEKWRPTCAQEVLGNEQSALYLRNWLRALELQFESPATGENQAAEQNKAGSSKRHLKRARVVRAVDKKRKKFRVDSDEEDDWIVQSDDDNDENAYEPLDDLDDFFLSGQPASSPASSCPEPSPSVSQAFKEAKEADLGQLHNTILLVGRHGVGKTASVYACAEELGWDVFEVYPGIGRRNGASVDNLVGEVGKNHLVLQNRQSADPLKSFFRQQTTQASQEDTRSGYSPRKRAVSVAPESDEPINVPAVRQSLILLEEVDILYKEDINFWPTVIRIIKECKRPVICTCNDISLVPLEELPLQSILYFEPPPADVAVSYLGGLCAAEGRPVEQEVVSGLYTNQDLRRTINALQVLSLTANRIEHAEAREWDSRLLSMRRAETQSFLEGMHWDSTMMEMASYEASEDDEMGHAILYDVHAGDTSGHDRHGEMVSSVGGLLGKVFDVDGTDDGLATEALEEKTRDAYRRVVGEVCARGVWERGAALEYIPLVRQMVAADDEGEARAQEQPGGRRTRNSGYVRLIGMTEEGRRVLLGCGLGR